MTHELTTLVWVAALHLIMWVPYILNVILANGLTTAVGYPEELKMAPWAERMKKAHYNAVENLVVFAPLVLVVHVTGLGNETTALACTVYFWARVVHWLVYSLGVPWVRTLAFAVSWLATGAIALQLL